MGAFARAHRHRCYCGCYTNISLSWISNFIASRCMTSSSNQHALPFFFFCLHHFHLGILDAEELTHLVHVLLFQQAPLKIVLPDVLVSSHRIVAAMLLTGASCGMVMTIIPWVAGISEWMHFQLHARLLHAACQVYPPHPPPSQVYAMVYRFPVTCFLTWLLQSRMLVHTNIT